MPIYFDAEALPEPGSAVLFSLRDEFGDMVPLQRFDLLRWRPHVNGDGDASAVMTWKTGCMDCGDPFTFTSGLTTGAFYRRCKRCRRGKQKVGWSKGPRIKHTLENALDPASLF